MDQIQHVRVKMRLDLYPQKLIIDFLLFNTGVIHIDLQIHDLFPHPVERLVQYRNLILLMLLFQYDIRISFAELFHRIFQLHQRLKYRCPLIQDCK